MARNARKVPKVRMNLDMHPEVKALIEDLQQRLHADSMSEVIRRSVQYMDRQMKLAGLEREPDLDQEKLK